MAKTSDYVKAIVDHIIARPDLPFTEEYRPWLESGDPKRLMEIALWQRPIPAPPDMVGAIRAARGMEPFGAVPGAVRR